MKKLITGLVIAINFIVSFFSYGADSQDNGLGQHFDPLLRYSSPLIPLPHLPTREEKERKSKKRKREEEAQRFTEERPSKRICLTPSEQQPTSSTTSSSSTSSTNSEHAVDKSPLEQLPTELFEHMWQLIPSQHRGNLALASQDLAVKSRYSRGHSQDAVKHLTIPVADITPENLHDAAKKFPKVTSLSITKAYKDAAITPDQLFLLAKAFPHITSLNLSGTDLTEAGIHTLAQPDTFASLESLNLSWNEAIGHTGITALIEAPFARTLKSLDLTGIDISLAGVIALATPHKLIALRELNLTGNRIGHTCTIALIEAPFVHTLESLDVSSTHITSAGVATLATPGKLIALKKLSLSNNLKIGDAGINALMNAPFAHTLEYLDLYDTDITSAGIEALAGPDTFPALKWLGLSENNKIGDAGIIALTRAPFAHILEGLNLYNTGITSAGIEALAAPDIFPALKVLNVGMNKIGDAGITTLTRAPFIHTLESLCVANIYITSDGVVTLATPGKLTALKNLSLRYNPKIDDAAITVLINAPFAHTLESLDLRDTGITSAGVATLATLGKLIALKELDLGYNPKIDDAVIAVLINAPFAHTLESLDLTGTDITSAGAEALAAPNTFPALKQLDLDKNKPVDNTGITKYIKDFFTTFIPEWLRQHLG